MRLLRNMDNGAVIEWDASRASQSNYKELSVEEIRAYLASPAVSKVMHKVPAPGDGIVFHLSARGIGDAVCGLYAACGLAQAGHKVVYYTRFPEYMPTTKIFQQGLQIVSHTEDMGANGSAGWTIDLEDGYEGVLKSRPRGYLRNICKAYGIDEVAPARPEAVKKERRQVRDNYILLAPFTHHANRQWPMAHWARLCEILMEEKRKPIVVGMGHDEEACRKWFAPIGVEFRLNQRVDQMIELIEDAAVLVGNDSGPAHLGGLYGTPTLAIFAQARPDYLYECATSIVPVTPSTETKCRFCFWTQRGGNKPSCYDACSALYSISPFLVADQVIATLRKRKKEQG